MTLSKCPFDSVYIRDTILSKIIASMFRLLVNGTLQFKSIRFKVHIQNKLS